MKIKMVRLGKYATLFLLLLSISYSCSDSTRDYLTEYEIRRMIEEEIRKNNQELEFTQWEIVNVNIKESDWLWDEEARRYDALVDLPELTKFIYEDGAQLGYVFIGEQGVNEVQKTLPYVHTYSDGFDEDGYEIFYTETISCDFQYGSPSTAAFYIQSSDLFRDDDILAEYEFRIVLVW
ncbi:MAG TPA: hypothetical protein VFC69_10175 [Dysgonamonadaceae bacterium]|nr:hypothetical protein [Dysgonamonadaceae bacterium]